MMRSWFEKGINVYQVDIFSNPWNECEKTSILDDLFLFKESKKSLKETPKVPFFV
jgi:hypothetical protein